jgi:hypothetical protein
MYVEVVMSTVVDHVTDSRGYVLRGDSRGILVDWQQRQAVWDWADQQNITVQYQGTLAGVDLWYVRDDQDRAFFALRWL